MKPEDLNTKIKPTWCPGCGNYGLFEALKRAIVKLNIPPEKILVTYGIGCHGHMVNFLKVNGFQGLHGRPIPLAIGAKLANPALTVFVSSGDGDAYSEGLNHLLGAAKANQNITLLVHNNWGFSLTTGQASPTTPKGKVTKSTPRGANEPPLNSLVLALSAGATFIARGYTGEIDHLTNLIIKAVKHQGFSLIDILQPCVVFGREYSPSWFAKKVYQIEKQPEEDFKKVISLLQEEERLPLGLFYQVQRPTFSQSIGFEKSLVSYHQSKKTTDSSVDELLSLRGNSCRAGQLHSFDVKLDEKIPRALPVELHEIKKEDIRPLLEKL